MGEQDVDDPPAAGTGVPHDEHADRFGVGVGLLLAGRAVETARVRTGPQPGDLGRAQEVEHLVADPHIPHYWTV
ncbi:MAG: hypothetical protein ABIS86_16105, partial [Streptosporangiaceae bacterium]